MIRRLMASFFALLMMCGLMSCSSPTSQERDYSLKLDQVEVNGPGTLGLSDSEQPVKGVVVYFHGLDQKADVIRTDQKHRDFFDPILRAGYAIVAADAQGNAFANPASLADYRKLIAAARAKYVADPVFYVGESMGALAALTLIAREPDRAVKGMVGISPLMGLPPEARAVNYVRAPWDGKVPDDADPLTWPPTVFAGHNFRLYASPTDSVIPPNASAQAFADRFGSVAKIEVVKCVGGHVAANCYQGAEVVDWMAGLR